MVGVIGGGSFGTAIANLLAENSEVLLYFRRKEAAQSAIENTRNANQDLHSNVHPIHSLAQLCKECRIIFILVPSSNFRALLTDARQFLTPKHILIHGTKGLDLNISEEELFNSDSIVNKEDVFTMSEVILQVTNVKRIGVIAGPNLSAELAKKQPAACVIASKYEEVIREGKKAIRSSRFQVFESNDVFGAEFSGILKNIVAIGAGVIGGLGYGENAKAMLITRGLVEMIRLGEEFGSDKSAFLGLAGIGDLIATCSSPLSRNYTVGMRLAKGESLQEIRENMEEVAEGVKTIKIIKGIAQQLGLSVPLISMLHRILFEGLEVSQGIDLLMRFDGGEDVDFI